MARLRSPIFAEEFAKNEPKTISEARSNWSKNKILAGFTVKWRNDVKSETAF